MTLSCRRVRRRLLAARDGAVTLAERLELDAHLAGCAACSAFEARDAALEQALSGLPEPPVERLDIEGAVRGVRAAIAARETVLVRRRSRRRLGVALAATAALACMALWIAGRRASLPEESSAPATVVENESLPVEVSAPVSGGSGAPDALAQAETAPDTDAALDLERLDEARGRACEALEIAAVESDLEAALTRLDGLLRVLSDEGWPTARLLERCLSDSDPKVAGLAARWLGRRGERLSIPLLADMLLPVDRDPALRAHAVAALLELGEPAFAALVPALDDDVLRPLVLTGFVQHGGPGVAAELRGALIEDGAPDADAARALDLARALAALGEPGLDALVDAAASAQDSTAGRVALATLSATTGAREHVTLRLGGRASRKSAALLRVAARLGVPAALVQAGERARDRSQRAGALAALEEFDGTGVWPILVALWTDGRVPEQDLLATARARLAFDPGEVPDGIRAAESSGDTAHLRALADLLIALEDRAAAPALVQLVAARSLDREERQWAALALIEVGSASEVDELTRILRELTPADLRLAAACAMAVHALGDSQALANALGPAAAERARQLAALFAARPTDHNRPVTLSRAGRLLEPWLDPLHPQRPRTTP